MIAVRWLQTNRIVLKGHCTKDGTLPFSSITIHGDGRYQIVLNLRSQHVLHEECIEDWEEVLPTLKRMLNSLGIDEDADSEEIINHLNYLAQFRQTCARR